MPGRTDHLAQARANRDFAEFLLATRPDDPTAMQWAVTAIFYCALHALDSRLADAAVHPQDHWERLTALRDQRYGIPLRVMTAYRRLLDYSKNARYEMGRFDADRVRMIMDTDLRRVTDFVHL